MKNNKWKQKLILDVVLTALYILLMFGYRIGALFHEVAGIGIMLLFGLHLAWNRKPFQGFLKAGMKGNLSPSKALLLASDITLTLALPASVVTGVLISQVVLHTAFSTAIYSLHVISAYATLAIMSLHLLLHAQYLAGLARHWYKDSGREGAFRLLKRAGAGCAAACVGYVAVSGAFSEDSLIDNTSLGETSDSEASAAGASGASYGTSDTETTPEKETSTPESQTAASEAETDTADDQTAASDEQTDDDDKSSAGSTNSDTPAEIPTLTEYLSKLFCTGCHRHCCLTNPQCGTGIIQQQQAETDYTEQYLIG